MLEANAVFQGGGVKAIALVGAVKLAEERQVRFKHVAGTSSGAMISAFLAAGYTAEDMKKMIMETPFQTFLQQTFWHRIKYVGPTVRLLLKKGLYPGDALELWVRRKLADKGIHTFADLPEKKLRIVASDISGGRLVMLPDDLPLYGLKPEQFEVSRAVRMSTSLPFFFDPVLIRNTKPAQENTGLAAAEDLHTLAGESPTYIVDGGVLSNFPLWIFDKDIDEWMEQAGGQMQAGPFGQIRGSDSKTGGIERNQTSLHRGHSHVKVSLQPKGGSIRTLEKREAVTPGKPKPADSNRPAVADHWIPTFGFQLVGKSDLRPSGIHGPITMLQSLFSTMMDAHDERYIEEHNRFRTIKIPTVGVGTTDFDIKPEESLKLFNSGYRAAARYFETKWSEAAYLSQYQKYAEARRREVRRPN